MPFNYRLMSKRQRKFWSWYEQQLYVAQIDLQDLAERLDKYIMKYTFVLPESLRKSLIEKAAELSVAAQLLEDYLEGKNYLD